MVAEAGRALLRLAARVQSLQPLCDDATAPTAAFTLSRLPCNPPSIPFSRATWAYRWCSTWQRARSSWLGCGT